MTRLAMLLAMVLGGGGLRAQDVPLSPAQIVSPVLTIDQEDLFAASAFGRRMRGDLEDASRALAAENRRIEGELTTEERALTDRRASLPPDDFRRQAGDFDARVVRIRAEQDTKTRDLARRAEQERKRFLEAALPVLQQLVAEAGAVAILDSRAVLLSSPAINVTDRAIARLDQVLGDGSATLPR